MTSWHRAPQTITVLSLPKRHVIQCDGDSVFMSDRLESCLAWLMRHVEGWPNAYRGNWPRDETVTMCRLVGFRRREEQAQGIPNG